MKKKEINKIKGMTINELAKETEILRKDIAKAQIERYVSPPKDTNEICKKKKRLAVVLTILKKKKTDNREVKAINSK